jgi:pyridoxal phosphate enzyme (YggS family)
MSALIKEQIDMIRQRIAEAARRSGRPASAVRLMAVTKSVDDRRILQAIDAGVDMIGENYVQEARRKIELMGKSVAWHLIGHLQTNKAKYAVHLFDMIHSLDRIELARELDRRSCMAGVVTKTLVEVNISGEQTKRGIPLEYALPLIREVSTLGNISVQGLMTMPPWFDDPQDARPFFRTLRQLGERVAAENLPRVQMRELSMGMSQDFEVAVEEGATIVRIGRSIFGERPR